MVLAALESVLRLLKRKYSRLGNVCAWNSRVTLTIMDDDRVWGGEPKFQIHNNYDTGMALDTNVAVIVCVSLQRTNQRHVTHDTGTGLFSNDANM